jgi:hypothetical protein
MNFFHQALANAIVPAKNVSQSDHENRGHRRTFTAATPSSGEYHFVFDLVTARPSEKHSSPENWLFARIYKECTPSFSDVSHDGLLKTLRFGMPVHFRASRPG